VPDDHHHIQCSRPCRAGVHQRRAARAGWVLGRLYRPDPARLTHWTCASSPGGASSGTCGCSRSAVPTSSASPATWKPTAAPGRRSLAGCTIAGFYRYAVEPGLPRGGLAAVRCAGPELHPAIRGGLRRGGRTGHSECRPQLMDLRSYAERRRRSGITPAEPPTGVADSCSAVASRGAQIRSLSAPRSTGFAR
jgi:hypothetical protein